MTAILPCPWCASIPTIERKDCHPYKPVSRVVCVTCGATGPHNSLSAVAAWNRRAPTIKPDLTVAYAAGAEAMRAAAAEAVAKFDDTARRATHVYVDKQIIIEDIAAAILALPIPEPKEETK